MNRLTTLHSMKSKLEELIQNWKDLESDDNLKLNWWKKASYITDLEIQLSKINNVIDKLKRGNIENNEEDKGRYRLNRSLEKYFKEDFEIMDNKMRWLLERIDNNGLALLGRIKEQDGKIMELNRVYERLKNRIKCDIKE